ncbi:hypothetical protein ACIQUF_21665 [Pseudomonas sp. NPDC090233]|uniref:hypothetical protein n=1 Tax=Pseudomonas sp. NPDC090233 TaxID=3364479 RepID=UPI00383B6F10
MEKVKSVGEMEFEYPFPFGIPQALWHKTIVLPYGDKRYVADSMESQLLVGRLGRGGAPDLSFAGAGFKAVELNEIIEIPGTRPAVAGLLLQEDGGVIGALGHKLSLGLARFTVDGELDRTFGINGTIVHTVGDAQTSQGDEKDNDPYRRQFSAGVASLIPGKDGKFYARSDYRLDWNSTIVRCQPNGALDTDFNGNGTVVVKHPNSDAEAHAIALSPTGGIVVAGILARPMRGFFCRYNEDGSLDEGFGDGGYAVFDSESAGIPASDMYQMEFNYVARLADEGFIACGYISAKAPWGHKGLLVRIDATGKIAESFNGGKPLLYTVEGTEADFLFGGIVEQNDRKILVAGGLVTRFSPPEFKREVLLARFLENGERDTSFGDGGQVLYQPFNNMISYVYSLELDHEQKILISGDGGAENDAGSMTGFIVQFAG